MGEKMSDRERAALEVAMAQDLVSVMQQREEDLNKQLCNSDIHVARLEVEVKWLREQNNRLLDEVSQRDKDWSAEHARVKQLLAEVAELRAKKE